MPIEATPATIDDILFTAEQLAARWQLNTGTLANLRARGEGVPWVKLPSGAIRYKMADILEAETRGAGGFTWERLSDALHKLVEADDAETLVKKLKKAL